MPVIEPSIFTGRLVTNLLIFSSDRVYDRYDLGICSITTSISKRFLNRLKTAIVTLPSVSSLSKQDFTYLFHYFQVCIDSSLSLTIRISSSDICSVLRLRLGFAKTYSLLTSFQHLFNRHNEGRSALPRFLPLGHHHLSRLRK